MYFRQRGGENRQSVVSTLWSNVIYSAVFKYTGLLIINPPPLRIFEILLFSHLLLFSKNLELFSQLLLVSKKFPPAAGFYYFQFFWAQNLTSEKLIFRQKSRFCLVKHPKKFRLRRAKNARFLLTSWKKFRLRRALIILKCLSQKFSGSYYSQIFFSKFSYLLLSQQRGGVLLLIAR